MKLVLFGAGSIGRSFIGQLFSRAGWEVVFVDIDRRIIDELNRRGEYRVEIRDRDPETILVKNVRGVNAQDGKAVGDEICSADLIATAVGKKSLVHVMPSIAQGLLKRAGKPIDIIICENMLDGAEYFREGLREHLPDNFPFDRVVGLVETSIGKMVPIMSEKDKTRDPLLVYAEAYNTLVLDSTAFKGAMPDVPGLEPRANIKAYVDRKLFIHNMGHAVLGYVSHVFRNWYNYVWEAAADPDLYRISGEAMWESGRSLLREYPNEFDTRGMDEYITDLLNRFKNRALGDTIFRVGRDLYRKLGPEDRLVGAIKLCRKQDITPRCISLATACAFFFKAADEQGRPYENDLLFHERESSKGVEHILTAICGLDDAEIRTTIVQYFEAIYRGNRDIHSTVFR
jgi:mannitol-1-phosphate 5-dehydrogenase